jgi:oligopeptide/dipeptide ABC transporter ATP-binding protein
MYLGRIVELADKKSLYHSPKHPYTQSLLSAVPVLDPDDKKERILLSGDIPDPKNPPQGCAFHTRCAACMEICKSERPPLKELASNHMVACHLY